MRTNPRLFISYSHENEKHDKWVQDLHKKLSKQYGSDNVIIDKKDLLKLGKNNLPKFMEKAVGYADIFICICTPTYYKKSNEESLETGVAYEMHLIKYFMRLNEERVIPILKQGDETSIPLALRNLIHEDFRNQDSPNIQDLVKRINQTFSLLPQVKPPSKLFSESLKNMKLRIVDEYDSSNSIDEPLIEGFKVSNVGKKYFEQPCITGKKYPDASQHVLNSLKNQNLILVNGEYGSGKSALCYNLLFKLCDRDNAKPIFIPLSKISSPSLLTGIREFMNKKYDFALTDKDFDIMDSNALINKEHLIFVIDGLDEIPKLWNNVDSYLAELNNLAKNNKIILTTRTNLLNSETLEKNNFLRSFYHVTLIDFERDQAERFIDKLKPNDVTTSKVMQFIDETKMDEIYKKPLFLYIICRSYHKLKDDHSINEAVMLEYLTIQWIEHESDKKEKHLSKLEIYNLLDFASIAAIKDYCGNPIDEENLKQIYAKKLPKNLPYCTFLNKGHDGCFRFNNMLVKEYLVARKIVMDLTIPEKEEFFEDTRTIFGPDIINYIKSEIIKYCFRDSTTTQLDKHKELNQTLRDFIDREKKNKKYSITNAVLILYHMNEKLNDIDLSDANISELVLPNADLSNNLVLKDGILKNARLNGCYFGDNKDLSNIKLDNADLSNTYLQGANLSGANLSGANLSGANLSGTIMSIKTDFEGSDLTHADFTNSKLLEKTKSLKKINFKDTLIFHTDFEGSELHNVDFSGSFFWQSDLADAKLENSNFSYTTIQYVRLRDTFLSNNPSNFDNAKIYLSPIMEVTDKKTSEKIKQIFKNNEKIVKYKELNRVKKLVDYLYRIKAVRYAGVFDERMIMFYGKYENKIDLKLHGKDKSILMHYTWVGWKYLKQKKYSERGRRLYSIGIYENLKVIAYPITTSDNRQNMIIVTTYPNIDHSKIIEFFDNNMKYIFEEISSIEPLSSEFVDNMDLSENRPRNIFNDSVEDIKERKKFFKTTFDLISFLEKTSENTSKTKIIYRNKTPIFSSQVNQITEPMYLWRRWRYREEKFTRKIGRPLYTITKYDKATVITSLISKGSKMLFVFADPKSNDEEIISVLEH